MAERFDVKGVSLSGGGCFAAAVSGKPRAVVAE
jgi:hypothetical protein